MRIRPLLIYGVPLICLYMGASYVRVPHVYRSIRVAPSSHNKERLKEIMFDCFANPMYVNHWLGSNRIVISKIGFFREKHAPDPSGVAELHDHVPVLAEESFRYLPVKRALFQKYGIASHWSDTHQGYWSAFRYCAMPSPTKPLGAVDPSPILWALGVPHPAVIDCCHEPVSYKAFSAKRLKLTQQAAEAGLAELRVNDLDVWAMVVRSGIKNTSDDRSAHLQLAAYAKAHCGETMVHYLWRRRHQLPNIIDDVWLWENVEEAAAAAQRTRIQSLGLAWDSACICGGAWLTFVISSFVQNKINIAELCGDVLDALQRGRAETVPVIVLAGRQGGEGKSIFFKALQTIFDSEGAVFSVTKESGNFPLLDLP